jgi:hypothetical protein
MNQELTAVSLPEEPRKTIPSRHRSLRDDATGSLLASVLAEAIPATDLDRGLLQKRSVKRAFQRESVKALVPDDRVILNLAFDRISQALQSDFPMAELSNCFDEWKDLLEAASRKVGSFTSSHRQILGSLLSVLHGKDISDFNNETLRIFRDATNTLRLPRISKQDDRRILRDLLKQKKKILLPLAIEESVKGKTEVLDDMMAQLILKSRSDK